MKKTSFLLISIIFMLSIAKAADKSNNNDSIGVALFEQFIIPDLHSPNDTKIFPASNYDAINAANNKIQYTKILKVYINNAFSYSKNGEHYNAEKMILASAMPISFAYGTEKDNYTCFMILAKSYFAQSKFTEAKWFFIQANTSSKRLKNKSLELVSLMEMAKVKKIIGDKKLALKDYTEAKKLAITLKSTFNIQLAKANIDALKAQTPTIPNSTTKKVALTTKQPL